METVRARRNVLETCLCQQLRHGLLKAVGHTFDCGEGDILLATLNLAVVSPVHLDMVCKAFLTESKSDATCPDDVGQGCLMRMFDHTNKLVAPVL